MARRKPAAAEARPVKVLVKRTLMVSVVLDAPPGVVGEDGTVDREALTGLANQAFQRMEDDGEFDDGLEYRWETYYVPRDEQVDASGDPIDWKTLWEND